MSGAPTFGSSGDAGPILSITPAREVREPITFSSARGDERGRAASVVRAGVADVRLEVFVTEQQVPFVQEIDARDFEPTTIHVLASGADGVPLGAGRLLLEPEHPGRAHLGRLAVRLIARGTGLGARMVRAIEAEALRHAAEPRVARRAGTAEGSVGGSVTVVLSAQEQAMGFYERCGYGVVDGQRYLDAGIWHRDMARTIVA